jgi:cell division protein FtsX
MYLLKLALRPWRLAPFSQLFAAAAVGLLLLMAGFLQWMQRGLRPVLTRLQGDQVITAYLDASIEAKDEARVVDSIRTSLGAAPLGAGGAVSDVTIEFVDTKKFIDDLRGPYPELSHDLEELGPDATSVVPRYATISGVLPATAVEKVRSVTGVESAETSRDRYKHVVGAFRALRWVARLLAGGLLLALLTGLVHLARMNSYLHEDAIRLLKLWGAGDWTLRAPAILSATGVGLLGGVLACAGWASGGAWLARHVRTLSPILEAMPVASASTATTLLLAGVAVGIMAGMLSRAPGGR